MSVWVVGALEALQDYDLALNLGEDPSQSPYQNHNTVGRTSPELPPDDVGLIAWWKGKEARLRAAGRITEDGFIRVVPGYVRPEWEISKIREVWPELTWEESVALLIKCDGVLTEKDMDAREMVVEVVREVVKQEMTSMFGTLLQALRAGTQALESNQALPTQLQTKIPGKKNCGNCGQPGHMKKTCVKDPIAA